MRDNNNLNNVHRPKEGHSMGHTFNPEHNIGDKGKILIGTGGIYASVVVTNIHYDVKHDEVTYDADHVDEDIQKNNGGYSDVPEHRFFT